MMQEFRALVLGFLPEGFGGRLFILRAPHGATFPLAVYSQVSSLRSYALSGDVNLTENRVQLDLYADYYQAVDEGHAALVAGLSGYRGGLFESIFIDGKRDGIETVGDLELFRVSTDFLLVTKE